MIERLSEIELRQICRSLATRLSRIVNDAQSPDEARIKVLASVLRDLRRASGVDLKKKIKVASTGNDADAYWYELQQTLVGFKEELVDYDYRGVITEELLDKIPSISR
jgi:hypothetical protein